MINEEKGVISILMAILIPVIILGVFYIYTLLDKPQQENTAYKIVFASSEAYLSRYNAYLFDQMGIIANRHSDMLEPIIIHYMLRNKLIENPESANLEIRYEQLNKPSVFKAAIVEASTVLIGNALVQYSIDTLNQFEFAEKVRVLNQSIESYEKKLSEQFDKIGATQFLKNIERSQDVQTGKQELAALEDHLNAQYKTYFETMAALKSVLTQIKKANENPAQAMITFLESKQAQWQASETAFMTNHQDSLNTISQIGTFFEAIDGDEAAKREIDAQIEAEKLKKPVNQNKLDQLMAICSEIDGSITSSFAEIDEIVSEKVAIGSDGAPSFMHLLKDLLLEAEYLFSGIKIGSAELKLEESFNHSANDREASNTNTLEGPDKVKVNEFYLSIFSSYDINCPRVFDPQNRHKTLRAIKGEVEYLISGLTKEQQSISLVRLKIVAIRTSANVVTLLSDKDKLARLSTATIALPQPWRSLAYGAAIAAWSGVESCSDINRLMKGEGFYFLKTKEQWATDFDALLDGTWKNKVTVQSSNNSVGKLPSTLKQDDNANILDPKLYYMDYLRLLMLMQDEQTTLLRAMDLVEVELLDISEGKTNLSNFSRGHTIHLTWNSKDIFGRTANEKSTIQMRNGFE